MLVTAREAAEILSMKVNSIYVMASQGRLRRHAPTHTRRQYDLDELEAMSLARLKFYGGEHPYWLTVNEATEVLGVRPTRVRALMDKEKIPHVTAPNGRRYVRRHQLEVVVRTRGRLGLVASRRSKYLDRVADELLSSNRGGSMCTLMPMSGRSWTSVSTCIGTTSCR